MWFDVHLTCTLGRFQDVRMFTGQSRTFLNYTLHVCWIIFQNPVQSSALQGLVLYVLGQRGMMSEALVQISPWILTCSSLIQWINTSTVLLDLSQCIKDATEHFICMKNENTANQARAYLQIPGLVMTIQILDTEVK